MAAQEEAKVISLCDRRRLREEMRALRPSAFVAEGMQFTFTVTHSTIPVTVVAAAAVRTEGCGDA